MFLWEAGGEGQAKDEEGDAEDVEGFVQLLHSEDLLDELEDLLEDGRVLEGVEGGDEEGDEDVVGQEHLGMLDSWQAAPNMLKMESTIFPM